MTEGREITPEWLEARLERFALEVLAMTRPLLRQIDGRDAALELRRAVTGAYSNYGAACVARSHADFTSKIGVALEEADESQRWLRLLRAAEILNTPRMDAIIREAGELRAILLSSHLTAKQNRDEYKRQGR